MKIALITDTHYGVRGDNVAFLDNNKLFMDNTFFPYLKEHNIDIVIHLGDVVDRRKYINFNTLKRLREDFLQPLNDIVKQCIVTIGNHDCFYKNTNEVNALKELIRNDYKNITVIDNEAQELIFDGLKIFLIPWINDTNRNDILEKIKNTNAQIAMGHLEISGFEMYKGSVVSHGYERNIFEKFDMVFSGHFHHRSTDGHIYYLGSHAEFTWSDYNDPRGFHVFDTETRELNFIENPYKMFKKIWYNDSDESFIKTKIDYSKFANCMVKVIVQEKNNFYWFDKFIENLESVNPLDLQIVEDNLNLNLEEDSDIINEAESTISIFKKYIEGIDSKVVDKNKLETKIIELYNEALNII
jgi:predicted phosphodiesterase